MIEVQTVNDTNYFLQYHRTRDFRPTTFTLERTAETGETEALLVRGSTPEEGIVCDVTVAHSWLIQEKRTPQDLSSDEEGSFDYFFNYIFNNSCCHFILI